MKCPKCDYLGFETGDRCKHCGYDFSLLGLADGSTDADLMLRPAPDGDLDRAVAALEDADLPGPSGGPADIERPKGPAYTERSAYTAPAHLEPALPLFSRAALRDDEPLIRIPAAPRPPLSVRRTTDNPRVKAAPSIVRTRDEHEPPLEFSDQVRQVPPAGRAGNVGQQDRRDASGAVPRIVAALIDIAILGAIDLAVVYFTVRMAALAMGDWRLLPPIPMLAFLTLLKLAYYTAFTAVGGQTIGKMAARIRVVTEDGRCVEPAMAIQRTLAAIASVVTLGAAFVPALLGASKRAFHDRVAHTRVVALPPA